MRYHGHDTARERAIYSKSIAAKKREDGMKQENKFWIRILLGIAGLILFAWLLDNAKVALELLRTELEREGEAEEEGNRSNEIEIRKEAGQNEQIHEKETD